MPELFRENIHFQAFIKELGLNIPDGYVSAESPDFLFELAGNTIGVEHTQIFLDGSKDLKLKAIESIGDDIASRVQIKGSFLKVNFQATLLFNLQNSMKESEREDIACYIFDEIDKELLGKQPISLESYEIRPKHRAIVSIRFVATTQDLTTRVTVARAGWVKQTIDEEVIGSIAKKNLKASSYTDKCDEVWLLIVADGHGPSSLFDEQPKVVKINYKSNFRKIYYLNFFSRKVTEVIANG
jgi:hypothetical protein